MEKIQLTVGGTQKEYMNESELQRLVDDLEAVAKEQETKAKEMEKYRDMWYNSYNEEVNKVTQMRGDFDLVRDLVNRLLK